MPRPPLLVERCGTVRDGLLVEADTLERWWSADGELMALFEGRRVKVTIQEVQDGNPPNRAGGARSVPD